MLRIGIYSVPTTVGDTDWATIQAAGFDYCHIYYVTSAYAPSHSYTNWGTYLDNMATIGMQACINTEENMLATQDPTWQFALLSSFATHQAVFNLVVLDEPAFTILARGMPRFRLDGVWDNPAVGDHWGYRTLINNYKAYCTTNGKAAIPIACVQNAAWLYSGAYKDMVDATNACGLYTAADEYYAPVGVVDAWASTAAAAVGCNYYFIYLPGFIEVDAATVTGWLQTAAATNAIGVCFWCQRTGTYAVTPTIWANISAGITAFRNAEVPKYNTYGRIRGVCAGIYEKLPL